MSVRAKFKVTKIECSTNQMSVKQEDGSYRPVTQEMRSVHMAPVYHNGDAAHENSKFWQYTPSGSLVLGTVNPEAWKHFELDGEYYIDFTKAGPEQTPG